MMQSLNLSDTFTFGDTTLYFYHRLDHLDLYSLIFIFCVKHSFFREYLLYDDELSYWLPFYVLFYRYKITHVI